MPEGGGSPDVHLNPCFFFNVFVVIIFVFHFFSFQRASLKRCPYAIVVLGCSDKTRGIIKVITRRTLKTLKKLKQLKNHGFRGTCLGGGGGGGGGSPHVPLNPWFFSFFQFFSVFSVSRELP